MNIDLWSLKRKAKKFYPNKLSHQKQWIRKTHYLLLTGKHVLYGGNPDWRRY